MKVDDNDLGPQRVVELAASAQAKRRAKPAPTVAIVVEQPRTDLGNTRAFVAAHGADLRHGRHLPHDGWLVWDGKRWAADVTGERKRRAKALADAMLREAVKGNDTADRAAVIRWALETQKRARIDAILALAESEPGIFVTPDALDADPWKLTVANGTLDLRTGTLHPHCRADLITRLVPIVYDPAAIAPRWHAFLNRIFDGDAELIGFVQRAAGYSMTAIIREHVMLMLYGLGANGKSTFMAIMCKLLGEYASQLPPESLVGQRFDSGGVPNDIARLVGQRLVITTETPEGHRLAEAKVKKLTGGDLVPTRFMRAEWFDFKPVMKLWMATNHKPVIRGTDGGIWRRIKLVPFTVSIPEEEQDHDLAMKLEEELSGILNWAVAGCLDWGQGGLRAPAVVTTATAEYREESDVLGRFLAECCIEGSQHHAKATDLYAEYTRWAGRHGEGEATKTLTAFGLELAARGYEKTRTKTGIWYIGLGIRKPADQE